MVSKRQFYFLTIIFVAIFFVVKPSFVLAYTFEITTTVGSNGNISPLDTGFQLDEGQSRTYIITPDTGYSIQSLFIDENEIYLNDFGNPVDNIGTTVNFDDPTATVTFNNSTEVLDGTQSHTISVTFVQIAPIITILGANPMSVYLNSIFEDPGITAIDINGQTMTLSDSCECYSTSSSVDTSILGSYTVNYSVTDYSSETTTTATATRTVNVINPVFNELVYNDYTPSSTNTRSGGGGGGGNAGGIMIASITNTTPESTAPEPTPEPIAIASTAESVPVVETTPQVVAIAVETPQPSLTIEEPVVEQIQQDLPPAGNLSATAETSNNFDAKDVGIAIVAISVLGFGAFQLSARNSPENRDKRKGKRCLHVGAIIEANLREMTSLEEKVEDMLKDKLQSKKAAKLIKVIKKLKDKHEKYSKLFADCVAKKDDKKKIVVIHQNDFVQANAWVLLLKGSIKKDQFDIKVVDVNNINSLKPSKDTLFINYGNVSQIVNGHFKSTADFSSIDASDIASVVAKLKSF